MAIRPEDSAPYGPPGPLIHVIERYRERGLQTPFTEDVLVRAGVNESISRRVYLALEHLDLVDDDGNPSEVLQRYANAPGDEARSILETAVRDAYEPIFRFVNPKEDSLDRIRDAFRSYQPRGQQDRMVTLFSGLCRYVGIMDDAPVRMPSPARPRQSVSKKPRPTRQAPADSSKNGVDNGAVRRTIHDDDLPPTLQGLTRELAVIGPTWSQERRNQFMQLLEAVIDFSYPANNPDE